MAFPTAQQQMLVVPDQPSGFRISDVYAMSQGLLGDSMRVVGDIVEQYEAQPETEQVDIMINFSNDPLKNIQTQPNLHLHVIGWGPNDIRRPVGRKELRSSPELHPQEKEPLHAVIHDLLNQQVFPDIAKDPAFNILFKRISDEHQAITYKLINGEAAFTDPGLSRIMQELHIKSQAVYNTVAAKYFAVDKESGVFIEDINDRYTLLPEEERIENINRYISEHPNLSSQSQQWLRFLAHQATDLKNIVNTDERLKKSDLTSKQEYLVNRFAAVKNLAYACVFSGIKKESGYDWEFGFDPIVFSTRGGLQASRGTQKVGIRNTAMNYDARTLHAIKASERKLGQHLIEKGQHGNTLAYEPGPQLLAA